MSKLPKRIKHLTFDINGVLIDKQTKQEIKKLLFDPEYNPQIPQEYWDFVDRLTKSKYSAGIISNASIIEPLTKGLKLDQFFDPIIFGFTQPYPKPHPSIFETYVEQSGFYANEIAYIDNNRSNLVYPASLGMFTILITPRKRRKDYILRRFCNLVLTSVQDLNL